MDPTPSGSTSAADFPATTAAADSADDLSSTTPAAVVSRWTYPISQRFQHLLDKSTPHVLYRWIAFACIASLYVVRVYLVEGFYVVSYALGIYLLNLLIGFLSPQVDPEFSDGPTLPTRGSDEFRPFVRRLPEFKLWCVISVVVALILQFIEFSSELLSKYTKGNSIQLANVLLGC